MNITLTECHRWLPRTLIFLDQTIEDTHLGQFALPLIILKLKELLGGLTRNEKCTSNNEKCTSNLVSHAGRYKKAARLLQAGGVIDNLTDKPRFGFRAARDISFEFTDRFNRVLEEEIYAERFISITPSFGGATDVSGSHSYVKSLKQFSLVHLLIFINSPGSFQRIGYGQGLNEEFVVAHSFEKYKTRKLLESTYELIRESSALALIACCDIPFSKIPFPLRPSVSMVPYSTLDLKETEECFLSITQEAIDFYSILYSNKERFLAALEKDPHGTFSTAMVNILERLSGAEAIPILSWEGSSDLSLASRKLCDFVKGIIRNEAIHPTREQIEEYVAERLHI